jgi:hypothetical protein
MDPAELALLIRQGECVSHLFFPMLHWRHRGEDGAAAARDPDDAPLRIPDTVVHTYSKPVAWYYFCETDRIIKKRPKHELSTMRIVEEFVKRSNPPRSVPAAVAVRAWFVEASDSTGSSPLRITSQRHCNRDGLVTFLQIPKTKGILQNYVFNKTESDGSMRNSIVACTYTPSSFSLERLVSRHLITDKAIPLSRRFQLCAEGNSSGDKSDPPYSSMPVMSPTVAKQFLRVCETVCRHLQRELGFRVMELALSCRIDDGDVVHILWCDRLKLLLPNAPESLFTATPHSTTVKLFGSSDNASPRRRRLNTTVAEAIDPDSSLREIFIGDRSQPAKEHAALQHSCPLCRADVVHGTMPRVQKRYVLFCLSLLDRNVDGWQEDVPPSVALLHPTIGYEEFLIVREDDEWLDEFLHLCTACVASCNAALETLTAKKLAAPAWLRIDARYKYGRSGRTVDNAAARGASGLRLVKMLRDASDQLDVEGEIQRKMLEVSPDEKKRRAAVQQRDARRAEIVGRRGNLEPATRDVPDSADLYDVSGAVWNRSGFGRPRAASIYVTQACRSAMSLTAPRYRDELAERLAELEERQADGVPLTRKTGRHDDLMGVPCHSPM